MQSVRGAPGHHNESSTALRGQDLKATKILVGHGAEADRLLGPVLPVGTITYFLGGPVFAALMLALGLVTFADAWTSGIYKGRSKKSFVNISPMGCGIVITMLSIVRYPVCLLNRNKLRTRQAGNGYFIATVVLGVVVIVLTVLNILFEPPPPAT